MSQKTESDRREYQKKYYRANREKALAYQRDYNKRHKTTVRRRKKGGKDPNRAKRQTVNLRVLACLPPEKFVPAFDRYISSIFDCRPTGEKGGGVSKQLP